MSEIICHCFEVSREEIENAIREKGLKTVEEVGDQWEIISLPAITKRSRMKIHYPGSFCYCVAE